MKQFLLFAMVLIICTASSAQYEESYIRFILRGTPQEKDLPDVISIAAVSGDTVFAFAGKEALSAIRTMGYLPETLPMPGALSVHHMADSPEHMAVWDRYPTYQTYLELMRGYASKYPALCRLDTIGFSAQGRLLLALKISKNVSLREDEPQILYTSSMHGNELTGYILMLRLAEYLLSNYGKVTPEAVRITSILNNIELYINPLFNPDGAYRLGKDTTIINATRANVNGRDLNRDFPDRISSPANGTRGRQPETAAMMRWTFDHNFSLSANFHGGALVALYPWSAGVKSGDYAACPDDKIFIKLATVYAAPNPDFAKGGFKGGISNSNNWYEVLGGRQDWMYARQGGHELTLEVSSEYIAPDSLLPGFWNSNKESMLAFLEQGMKGLRGRVTAAGLPMKASIDIIEIGNSPVFSDPAVGTFLRPLVPGTYTVVASAYGYRNDTIRNVVITDSGATRLDVELQKITSAASVMTVPPERYSLEQNYPNPFNPSTSITYHVPEQSIVRLTVYNTLGQNVFELANEEKRAGTFEYRFNASSLSSGMYFYRFDASSIQHPGRRFTETKKMMLLR
ncbi:MAG: M14 family zinc carboxypeptidase [Bacteroidota bacterium]